jgi:hypothetical protein
VQLLRRLAASPELIPGLLAVGVFVAWDVADGGFPVTSGNPGGLFLLGLLVAAVVAFRSELVRLPRVSVAALTLFAAFTVWSFVSIAWADAAADAWDGANRTLIYLTVFALFTVPRWRTTSAVTVMGAYSVSVAVVGMAVMLTVTGSNDPTLYFTGSRLAEPTGYTNAVAALFAAAVWPSVFLASRRETPWPARGLFLAAAGVLVQLALIPQSRGAFIAFPIALALYLAIVPNRLRSIIVMVPIAVATVVAAPALLDLFTVIDDERNVLEAVDRAGRAVFGSAVVLAVVGVVLGLVDRGIAIPEQASRLVGRVVAGGAAVGAVIGTVLLLGVIGNPVDWAEERWDDFQHDYDPQGFGSSRFSGDLGSGRYDFWRVAIVDEFGSAPLVGAGADNFAVTYLGERESADEPLYPHSLPIRVLAGTGIIGGLLFGSFLVAGIWAAVRTLRGAGSQPARGAAAVAVVAFAYWFVHASGDWLWSFTGLAAPALAWLAIAGRVESGGPTVAGGDGDGPFARRSPATIAALACGVLAVGFAAISYILPWAATRDVDAAERSWRSDPEGAFDRLDRARRLNFLSSEPDVVTSTIAGELDRPTLMRASLERALDREPTNWYAWLALGTLDGAEGRRSAAVARLRRAAALNPRDPLVRSALRRAREGRPMSMAQINRALTERVCSLVGRTNDTRFCE